MTKSQSKYRQCKLKKSFKRRAAIEPTISHLKTDHRLSRNFYKGIFGDNINVMLSAAAFNFKRMMNIWKQIFLALLQRIVWTIKKLFLPNDMFPQDLQKAFLRIDYIVISKFLKNKGDWQDC